MKWLPQASRFSIRLTLVFWWGLFLVIQQAERLFLLPEATRLESPTAEVLIKTLVTGLRADIIVATLAIMISAGFSALLWSLYRGVGRRRIGPERTKPYSSLLFSVCAVVGLGLSLVLVLDMAYYGYNHRRLDFVFFEYIGDLFGNNRAQTSQAALQTQAEMQDAWKWGGRVALFVMAQIAAIVAWWYLFRGVVEPSLGRLKSMVPRHANLLLVVGLMGGIMGFHPYGPWSVQRAGIASSTYYSLAQNPVWYGSEVMLANFTSGVSGTVSSLLSNMDWDQAVAEAQTALAPHGEFPQPRYPLVRQHVAGKEPISDAPANVLLIFIEGLDRRYLGRTLDPSNVTHFLRWFIYETPQFEASAGGANFSGPGIRVTPFLDALRHESVFFENFFGNGTQTARGLFATLCSYYPRQGTNVMKTRYTFDYLCLPSVLREAGYTTEMVIGQNRDRNYDHIGLFLGRNGLDRLLDESDFPSGSERLGIGMTDGALFDFMRSRIEILQKQGRPFFLTTVTTGTHHPYTVPTSHPDVRTLQKHADRYVAALRHADLEFERFFTGLKRDGLLRNTIVLVLGDHGRHHGSGRTETERWAGHFTVPLYLWIDDSLRTPDNYRPRTVRTIASQVDLAPTILAMNGLLPRMSPFLGQDLSCLLAHDCLENTFAFLTSVYDDVVGLADREGIWFYSFRDGKVYQNDLQFNGPAVPREPTDPDVAGRYRRMLALYVASNALLEQNRIWSWRDLGGKL